MIELNGRRLGIDAEVTADYAALREGVALVDLSDRGRMRFHGDGAKPALNGLLTCDVAPLARGQGAYGAALTNKGKVIADVTVFAMENSVLVECPPVTWDAWKQLIAKFVNPRLTKRTDETDASGEFALCGPEATRAVAALTGLDAAALEALAPYSHFDVTAGDTWLNVARFPDVGVDGFRVLGARDAIDAARQRAVSDGARVAGPAALEAARIEAGRPVWGADMDDNTIPQEANLEALGAISYTKGCYTGQEVVARLHFRGHVNKRLVGLRVEGSATLPRGTSLATAEGKECGDVRSSVVSPRYGPIALAMVRREVAVGDTVIAGAAEGAVNATVSALPFDA